jgi:hypothetical protein
MARRKRKGVASYITISRLISRLSVDRQTWKFRPRWWDDDRYREAAVQARLNRPPGSGGGGSRTGAWG